MLCRRGTVRLGRGPRGTEEVEATAVAGLEVVATRSGLSCRPEICAAGQFALRLCNISGLLPF